MDHRLAMLVNQGSDPTLPYQALVIRESASLMEGFAPCDSKAFSARAAATVEVYSPDSFDCTAPTPRRAKTSGKMLPSNCGPRRRPSRMRCISCCSGAASAAWTCGGSCSDGRTQVAEHVGHIGVVFPMESDQLVENVMSPGDGRVAKDLPAGDHLEGDAAEAQADFDAGVAWVLAGRPPVVHQDVEVMVALDQVVGDAKDGATQGAVAAAHQRAVGMVDSVALIAGRKESGATGDRLGVGVVLDGSHLAGEVGGADHVDAGEREQEHVRRVHQAGGDGAFQSVNFLGFCWRSR
jgi:hypothetical protein